MSAKSRATQYRQWAVNAIVAMQSTSSVDRETRLMIAREHLAQAEKAERTRHPAPDRRHRRAKRRPAGNDPQASESGW